MKKEQTHEELRNEAVSRQFTYVRATLRRIANIEHNDIGEAWLPKVIEHLEHAEGIFLGRRAVAEQTGAGVESGQVHSETGDGE